MCKTISVLITTLILALITGCASVGSSAADRESLVGAWIVTASRPSGLGKNLLTFSSDGTFFRSGDTHPVLSGAHGAWKLVGPNLYHASYVSFSFDASGKWTGINRNNLAISVNPDGNEFNGTVKSSSRDLEDKEIRTGTSQSAGKPIQGERV